MTVVLWMAAASVLSALLVSAAYGIGTAAGRAIWLGMLAPLVVVSGSWILTERIYRRRPERLTSMMMSAFAGKLVLFGAYVSVTVGVLGVPPVPFIVSFTTYFIVLHLVEALCLKRMFVS